MRSAVGDGDVVARLGGDEFAVLLGAASTAESDAVLGRPLTQRETASVPSWALH
ncbi:diguanylate cyclase [Actinoplanes sp. NPDC051475]|uniref:diguanylate cyclase domain-containing protein n=1 Tax=Actinoplanes sp. NPDC051475 TaxID=3157225 RepID=UPI00344E64AC